jgi:hypothetical protein
MDPVYGRGGASPGGRDSVSRETEGKPDQGGREARVFMARETGWGPKDDCRGPTNSIGRQIYIARRPPDGSPDGRRIAATSRPLAMPLVAQDS